MSGTTSVCIRSQTRHCYVRRSVLVLVRWGSTPTSRVGAPQIVQPGPRVGSKLREIDAKRTAGSSGSGTGGDDEDEVRGERLQLMLTPEELMALDDFRFKNRMPSRAAAVRELLKRGLGAKGFAAAYGTKSSDYGVTARPAADRKPA